GGAVDAEVAGVDDDLDARVLRGDPAQDFHRAVLRGIVDEDVLARVAGQVALEDRLHRLVAGLDVVFLVVAGRDDGDLLHGAQIQTGQNRTGLTRRIAPTSRRRSTLTQLGVAHSGFPGAGGVVPGIIWEIRRKPRACGRTADAPGPGRGRPRVAGPNTSAPQIGKNPAENGNRAPLPDV